MRIVGRHRTNEKGTRPRDTSGTEAETGLVVNNQWGQKGSQWHISQLCWGGEWRPLRERGGGLVVVGISETMIQALDSEHTCLGSTQKWGVDFRGKWRPEINAEPTLAKGQKHPPWSTSTKTWRGRGRGRGAHRRGWTGREVARGERS